MVYMLNFHILHTHFFPQLHFVPRYLNINESTSTTTVTTSKISVKQEHSTTSHEAVKGPAEEVNTDSSTSVSHTEKARKLISSIRESAKQRTEAIVSSSSLVQSSMFSVPMYSPRPLTFSSSAWGQEAYPQRKCNICRFISDSFITD